MASLLNRLFPSRTRTARRTAQGRTPAKTRLGIETLDAREMPSVTSVLNGGVLTITADGPNTNASATQSTDGIISVLDKDKLFVGGMLTPVGNYHVSAVTKIVYNGGKDATKTYNFMDATDRPTTFNVGPGYGAIYGGKGVNTFIPDADNHATLFAGIGTNILNRNETSAVLRDAPFVPSGPKLSYGLISGTPTPDQLAATGALTATLDKGAVSIAGPSGIGFQLKGNWTDFPLGNGAHIFFATGDVKLHTASGLDNIPVSTGMPVMVTTKASSVQGVPGGEFASISWAGIPLNSADGPFSQLGSKYGLSVSGGTSWGIKLGKDLDSLDVPLNPGVPYLYYSSTTGAGISFGSANLNTSGSKSSSVAVDPADPSMMLKYGDYGFGVSLKGEIPYTPTHLPDGIKDPKIYGNVYATGSVPLGDLPGTLTGGVVIDLDANDDGTFCGLTSQTLDTVLRGGAPTGDIKFGVNGEIDFSLDKYSINLSAPVGEASAFYTPESGRLAFRGKSVNPFAGTVLEQFSQSSTFDLQGWVDGSKQWSFKAEARGGNYFGFQGDSLEIDGNSQSETLHAHLTLANKVLGVGKLNLDGQVNWRTGEFDLNQTAMAQLDVGVCTFYMTEIFDLSYHNGAVAMNVVVCGAGAIGTTDYNVHAGVMGTLTVSADGHGGYRVAGSLSASVGGTWAGTSHDTQLAEVTVDNSGFSIDIGGYHPRVNW
jgi:hypothetical protein